MKKDSIILLYMISVMVSIVVIEAYMFIFNVKEVNADTYLEATVDGITWQYTVNYNNAVDVRPKDKSAILGEIEIPSSLDNHSVTSIGTGAFSNCTRLTGIVIPDSVTSIGASAFSYCRLTDVSIPEGVTCIQNNTFAGCQFLEQVTIPAGVTRICISAFSDCNRMDQVILPKELIMIEDFAFCNCYSLEEIIIPDGVTTLGNQAFDGCTSLRNVSLSNNVKNIGAGAFFRCKSLENIIIPDGVEKIGFNAFSGCNSLTSITIPKSVTNINTSFSKCSNLTEIIVDEDNINYASDEFGVLFNKDKTILIQYPIGNIRESYTVPYSVTNISNQAFSDNKSLTNIIIGSNVTLIENDSFYRNSSDLEIYTNSDYTAQYAQSKNISYILDKEGPSITSIEGNSTEWTKENVTLTVTAEDDGVGLADEAYSFDGGTTWQQSNSKTFSENTSGIIIQVRDELDNVTTLEPVNISNIDKEGPSITSIEGNPTEWTKENVTLTVTAEDTGVGLADEAYSFDGGETWQQSNSNTYDKNTSGVIIQVKDKLGNVTQYQNEITIDKIRRFKDIQITVSPDKVTYKEGEDFDSRGMVVSAVYDNGNIEAVDNYTILNGKKLTLQTTEITISYTQDGETKTATQPITVLENLKIDLGKYKEEKNGKLYITKIISITNLKNFLQEIKTNGNIEVYNDEEKIENDTAIIKTGMKVIISLRDENVQYATVVTGDLNGDGVANDIDLLKMARYMAGLDSNLKDEYLRAANTYEDAEYADEKDLLKLARMLVGLE